MIIDQRSNRYKPITIVRHEFVRPDPLPENEAAQRKCVECGFPDGSIVHKVVGNG